MDLLEADARAESHWARAPTHRASPVSGAISWSSQARVTGPVRTLTGQVQVSGANSSSGPAFGPNLAGLKQFQICTDFPK